MMDIGDIVWFPFWAAGMTFMLLLGLLFFIIWIYIIIDCAKRKFKNPAEKIIWLLLIVLTTWIGSLVYLIVIMSINKHGILER